MASGVDNFSDLEARAAAGDWFSRADAERLWQSTDLVSIGAVADAARRRLSGDDMTFGRVLAIDGPAPPPVAFGQPGEVRLTGRPATLDEALSRARQARAAVGAHVLTGFSAVDLLELCRHDHLALADCAARLRAEGLEAVAECPIDRLGGLDEAVEVVRAIASGGLGVWRLTVCRAPLDERVAIAERAASLQLETGFVRAFAPLPREDVVDAPSTGYDDVRTVAVARLVCREIPCVQVDWPLYGPKLAQVALLYGANDVDGIAAADTAQLGPRRSPVEEIRRQIRAASGVPVERNGRYERIP
jgi:aminodeoxyfutalosine synthase